MNNPLLTPFETAPFSKIKNEHFSPAIHHFIAVTKTQINEISENKEAPTFKNTIEALDGTGIQLDRITSIFFNLNSAETNDEIQKIAQEISPALSDFKNDLLLNEKLFKRVKQVYENRTSLSLNKEQTMLLKKSYIGFTRNGANLSYKDKDKLREIDGKLSKLKLQFGENVLAETNKFYLQITNEKELSGLPDGVIEMAAQTAKEKKMTGWVFTLDYPSYVPFVTYSNLRELRKKITIAFGQRAFKNNVNDNQASILEIVNLRHQRAQLLGYPSHAHFVLEERMAKTPEKVLEFLTELLEKAKPAAQSEFKKLEDFAKELDGIDQLEKWDAAYYSEKLKQKLFDLDDEKLKPYFKLENVIEGVFKIANKLYQLNFKEVYDVDTYHKDVKTYEVTDQNKAIKSLF